MAIKKTIKSKPTNPKESKSNAKKVVAFLFKAVLWFLGISIFFVVIFKWIPIPFTPLMIVRAKNGWKRSKMQPRLGSY